MSLSLDQISIRQVRGVSALKEGELHAFGIFTVKDLLEYYPFVTRITACARSAK